MVSVYREFESRSSERIFTACFSAKHTAFSSKGYDKPNWDGIRIMCPKRATCLPAEFPFGELAL
jgi:hypothetical protein